MFGPLRGFMIAAALSVPSAGVAQLQVNQNFVTQGPAPSFGPVGHGPERRCAAEWKRGGRGRAGGGRPLGCEHVFMRHAGAAASGRRRTAEQPGPRSPTSRRRSRSRSLALDPTDANPQNFDRGDGPHRQRHGLSRLEHASLPVPAACGTDFCTRRMAVTRGLRWARRRSPIRAWSGLAARGSVMVAGTFEISGLGGDKNAGALYRSTNGGGNLHPNIWIAAAPAFPMGRSVRSWATPTIQLGFMPQ